MTYNYDKWNFINSNLEYMDRLKSLSVLIKVADSGSFTRCAEDLKMGQPTVSKAIDSLEKEFGVKLFHRSTRKLAITEEGRKILIEARKVVDSYDGLLSVSQLKLLPKGTVKVTCPSALGTLVIMPLLENFKQHYPEITVHLMTTDLHLDMYENDLDVAFRVGEIHDSSLVAKRIGEIRRIAVAGRQYLKHSPAPRSISDLSSHRCIAVSKTGGRTVWKGTTQNGHPFSFEVDAEIEVDNHLALRAAVDAGLGIGLAGSFVFLEDGVLQKNFVQVLEDFEFTPYPAYIVFKQSRSLPARTRVFVDHFYQLLCDQSWLFN